MLAGRNATLKFIEAALNKNPHSFLSFNIYTTVNNLYNHHLCVIKEPTWMPLPDKLILLSIHEETVR